jgi:hypothetical protein
MKTKKVLAFAAAASIVFSTGCASMLNRDYASVTPHTSQYWENGNSDTLRAEDYQSLVNDLLVLVAARSSTGVVRLYDYADAPTATADLDNACVEVKLKDPLGSWAVSYINYTVTQERTYYEASVSISYAVTKEQMDAIVNTTTSDALGGLVAEAIIGGKSEIAAHVSYLNGTADTVRSDVAAALTASGKAGNFTVTYYPDEGKTGDTRIIDVKWDLPPEAAAQEGTGTSTGSSTGTAS